MSDKMPKMTTKFSSFTTWARIEDPWEGSYVEKWDRNAFDVTFRQSGKKVRALFQHGRDPQLGQRPIGRIDQLRSEPDGAYADIQLYEAAAPLVEALRDSQLAASFAFVPVRSDVTERPGPSSHNPLGLREVVRREVKLREVSAVTFPAFEDTHNELRSADEPPVQRMRVIEDDEPRKFTDRSWLRWLDRRLQTA